MSDEIAEPAEDNSLARLPRPGEVIKSPYEDLAVEKVAPDERAVIRDLNKVDVGIRLPNPFEGVELPSEDPMVKHPNHYNAHPSGVECWDIVRHMTFLGGNAFKYVFRFDSKDGERDLRKAVEYAQEAVQHADALWLPNTYLKVRRPLQLVVEYDTIPQRSECYKAFAMVDRTGVLAAIQTMLNSR